MIRAKPRRRGYGSLGGAMFGAGQRDRERGRIPDRWSFLQGRMGGGMALPPGVRVPMGNDVRRPPVPGPAAPAAPPATGGPLTVAPPAGGLQGPLGAAMGGAPGMAPPATPAGPAAPGQGIPAGMPPPDAGAPQRPPTGGPLLAAMLGPTASPQALLQRAGYRAGGF